MTYLEKPVYQLIIHAILIVCMTSCYSKPQNTSDFTSKDLSGKHSVNLVNLGHVLVKPDNPLLLRTIWDPIRITYNSHYLMLLNFDDHHIILINKHGDIKSNFGKTGSGPEELRSAYTLGFDEYDRVIVFDHNQDLFKIFNADGQFLTSLPGMLKDNLWNRGKRLFGYENKIYSAIQEAGKTGSREPDSALIAEYDSNGDLLRLISRYDDGLKNSNKLYLSPVIHLNKSADTFYTGHRTWPIIRAIDRKTGLDIARFGFVTENFSEPVVEINPNDPPDVRQMKRLSQTALSEIYSCSDFVYAHFFNLGEFFTYTRDPNDKHHFLYIFKKSENYAFIGEIELPFALGGIDYNGTIYLIEDDDPDNFTLGIYKINEVPYIGP